MIWQRRVIVRLRRGLPNQDAALRGMSIPGRYRHLRIPSKYRDAAHIPAYRFSCRSTVISSYVVEVFRWLPESRF